MKITVSVKHLQAALYCASKKDVRYYLNGVLIEANPSEVRVVGTDGHVIAVLREQAAPGTPAVELIVPRDVLESLKTKAETVTLESDDGQAWAISDGQMSLRFNAVDAKFPDYRRIIPGSVTGLPGNYSSELLSQFAKVAKVLRRPAASVTLYQNGPNDAALVSIYERPEFCGVIMPCWPSGNRTKILPDAPTWARERA